MITPNKAEDTAVFAQVNGLIDAEEDVRGGGMARLLTPAIVVACDTYRDCDLGSCARTRSRKPPSWAIRAGKTVNARRAVRPAAAVRIERGHRDERRHYE